MIHFVDNYIGSFFVNCISEDSVSTLDQWLLRMQFRVYWMTSNGVVDEGSLMDAVRAAIGRTVSGPEPSRSWDAGADHVWDELMDREDKRVAIVWRGADEMLEGRLELLLDGIEWLNRIASEVMEHDKIEMRLCLLGRGPSFPH